MTERENSVYRTLTGGKAKFIRTFADTATDKGISLDLSGVQYELLLGETTYIKILNTGSSTIFVAFDTELSTIDIKNFKTFNLRIPSLEPYNEVAMYAQANRISLICASSEESTFEILTW